MFDLDSDTLWRSAIRRKIGFDFDLKEHDRYIIIRDLTSTLQVRVNKEQGMITEKVIDRLVKGCMRLKKMHDEELTI